MLPSKDLAVTLVAGGDSGSWLWKLVLAAATMPASRRATSAVGSGTSSCPMGCRRRGGMSPDHLADAPMRTRMHDHQPPHQPLHLSQKLEEEKIEPLNREGMCQAPPIVQNWLASASRRESKKGGKLKKKKKCGGDRPTHSSRLNENQKKTSGYKNLFGKTGKKDSSPCNYIVCTSHSNV